MDPKIGPLPHYTPVIQLSQGETQEAKEQAYMHTHTQKSRQPRGHSTHVPPTPLSSPLPPTAATRPWSDNATALPWEKRKSMYPPKKRKRSTTTQIDFKKLKIIIIKKSKGGGGGEGVTSSRQAGSKIDIHRYPQSDGGLNGAWCFIYICIYIYIFIYIFIYIGTYEVSVPAAGPARQ